MISNPKTPKEMRPLTSDIEKAFELACKAHQGQTDKGGMAYIAHPLHVAMTLMANGYDDNCIVAGLLHDVVEDTQYTLEDISAMGFARQVVEALSLLTHDKSMPYMEYVERVSCNPVAKAVKMADLIHNMDMSRLKEPTAKDHERIEKYREAYAFLNTRH